MTTTLHYELGLADFEQRRYAEAIDHFEQVLESAPQDMNVREYLVRAHYHRAALTRAIEQARAILVDDPTNEYVMLLLARALERKSRHDEAAVVRRRLAALTGEDGHLDSQAFSA